jgi:hypothetical protein
MAGRKTNYDDNEDSAKDKSQMPRVFHVMGDCKQI